jgi:hypothetical protein
LISRRKIEAQKISRRIFAQMTPLLSPTSRTLENAENVSCKKALEFSRLALRLLKAWYEN